MDVVQTPVESKLHAVSIWCSWNELKNRVDDAFSFVDFTKEEAGDSSLSIGAESCVLLGKPEGSDLPLTVDIKLNDSSLTLRKLHIISEANYVEVYGLFGEYLKTVVGDLIEDVDGTLAFSCLLDNIKLPQVTLKLVGLKGAKEVWLFGGCIWSERDEGPSTSSGRINMERIDSRLSEGNYQLSPSADSLKKLVSDYLSHSPNAASFQNIASSLASMQKLQGSRLLSGQEPISAHTFEFLKTYVDSSLKNMERRLMDNITEQIRELELRQNKRLDHILKLLENSAPSSTNNP